MRVVFGCEAFDTEDYFIVIPSGSLYHSVSFLALYWCRRLDSNQHSSHQGILSPSRLPFRHVGLEPNRGAGLCSSNTLRSLNGLRTSVSVDKSINLSAIRRRSSAIIGGLISIVETTVM